MKKMSRKLTSIIIVIAFVLLAFVGEMGAALAQYEEQTPVLNDEPVENSIHPVKEKAPKIVVPEGLKVEDGQTLNDVALPKGWTWVDGAKQISQDKKEYPARYDVDDVTYDYTSVEGYNDKGHYVEKMISVEISKKKVVEEKTPVKKPSLNAKGAEGDIVLNEENFPDPVFREFLTRYDRDKDEILSKDEYEIVTQIIVSDKNISDLTGLSIFKNLEYLFCDNTKITTLDARENPNLRQIHCERTPIESINLQDSDKLEYLQCNDTNINELNLNVCENLTYLNCSNTKVSHLNLSHNPKLAYLYCTNIRIPSLDLSHNKSLVRLLCEKTDIESLDVSDNTKLTTLYCDQSKITNINLENCISLKDLICRVTRLTKLDVSTCPALQLLWCGYTKIAKLDLSHNVNLHQLSCSSTQIKDLDLSNNKDLTWLSCNDTKLRTLDVRANTALETLKCYNNAFYSLDVGSNSNIKVFKSDSVFDIGKLGNTFDMRKKFPGIDVDKVTILSGATLDKDTGIVSGYSKGVPIIYSYDCGEVKDYYTLANGEPEPDIDADVYEHGAMPLKVTLNFTMRGQSGESTLVINDKLDKVYDGKPVSNPSDVTQTGSQNKPTYEWYVKDGNNWKKLNSSPVNVGHYKVVATVEEDDEYLGVTAFKEFEILPKPEAEIIPDKTNTDKENDYTEDKSKTEVESSHSVKTDDHMNVGLWISMVVLSTAMMVILGKKKSKE